MLILHLNPNNAFIYKLTLQMFVKQKRAQVRYTKPSWLTEDVDPDKELAHLTDLEEELLGDFIPNNYDDGYTINCQYSVDSKPIWLIMYMGSQISPQIYSEQEAMDWLHSYKTGEPA